MLLWGLLSAPERNDIVNSELVCELFSHHFLQVFLFAHIHHDQTFFDQAETHVIFRVSKLQSDVWTSGASILHI